MIMKYCHNCQRSTKFNEPRGPKHWLHAVLSVITFGLWVIVWVCVVLYNTSNRAECSECGVSE